MKIKKKILIVLPLAIMLIFSVFSMGQTRGAFASSNGLEAKIYSSATLEDDFADDAVMVVMKKETTYSQKKFDTNSFSEVACTKLENLTESTEQLIEKQIFAEKTQSSYKTASLNEKQNLNEIKSLKERSLLVDKDNFRRILRLELKEKSKENVLRVINQLEKRDDVLYAGPDYIMQLCAVPYPLPTYYNDQWAIDKIELPAAWNITTGSASVTVGVLDTGIDGTHPDLSDRVNKTLSRDFTVNPEIKPSPVYDDYGHGSHVAGIIGANRNSGRPGVIGANWDVSLVSLKIWINGSGYASWAARAIDYATNQGIDILNLSGRWYPGNSRYDVSLKTSISNYPGLFVCAAGNEGTDNDTEPCYPAAYSLPNLITVGATDINDNRADFSNYGTSVSIYAPGVDILSTTKGSSQYMSGTSMASPYVAGVAALIKSIRPDIGAAQIKNYILGGCDDICKLVPNPNGNGYLRLDLKRLNAYKAVIRASFRPAFEFKYVWIKKWQNPWDPVMGNLMDKFISVIRYSEYTDKYQLYLAVDKLISEVGHDNVTGIVIDANEFSIEEVSELKELWDMFGWDLNDKRMVVYSNKMIDMQQLPSEAVVISPDIYSRGRKIAQNFIDKFEGNFNNKLSPIFVIPEQYNNFLFKQGIMDALRDMDYCNLSDIIENGILFTDGIDDYWKIIDIRKQIQECYGSDFTLYVNFVGYNTVFTAADYLWKDNDLLYSLGEKLLTNQPDFIEYFLLAKAAGMIDEEVQLYKMSANLDYVDEVLYALQDRQEWMLEMKEYFIEIDGEVYIYKGYFFEYDVMDYFDDKVW